MEPHWTNYVTAMMTPVVACFGAWIAYQQWVTARDKLRLDLYERRMVVYGAVRGALRIVSQRGQLTQEDQSAYLEGISGAQWLFGKEIDVYLSKDFFGQLCDLDSLITQMDGLHRGPELSMLVNKKAEQRKWFNAQYDHIGDLFYPYLGFDHRSVSTTSRGR